MIRGLYPRPHLHPHLVPGVVPRISVPLSLILWGVCVQDPYFQGLGKRWPRGLCPRPWSPGLWLVGPVPGPPPRTTLSSLGTLSPSGRRGRLPPSATSAAAPPPTRAPLSRPSHAGRRAAGHPGPGRPRLPRPWLGPAPRLLLLLLLRWRRRQLGLTRARARGRGMVRDARARACLAPGRIPFRGRGSVPRPRLPAPAPPIGPPPAVYAERPRPAPAPCRPCPAPWPADPAPTQTHPAFPGAATAPPRPLASPGLSMPMNIAESFPRSILAWTPFPSVTPDLRSPPAPRPKELLLEAPCRPTPPNLPANPMVPQPGGGGQKR